MQIATTSVVGLLAASLAFAAEPQQSAPAAPAPQVSSVPPIPATPAAIGELVYARPFTLGEGYVHEWRKERPTVDAGIIVVLRVDKDLVRPRQVAQPVLMVGSQVAEPVNIGYGSGTVVAIVPAPRTADGNVDLDLSTVPIWFAQPELPERIDATDIAAQRGLAERSGIAPTAKEAVAAAKQRGASAASLPNREALDKVVGALVRTYAPDESEKADQLEGVVTPAPAPASR